MNIKELNIEVVESLYKYAAFVAEASSADKSIVASSSVGNASVNNNKANDIPSNMTSTDNDGLTLRDFAAFLLASCQDSSSTHSYPEHPGSLSPRFGSSAGRSLAPSRCSESASLRSDIPSSRLDSPSARPNFAMLSSNEEASQDRNMALKLNVKFAKNITFLSRYLKFYLHKVLSDTNLGTEGEYSYLMVLSRFESLNKTELNNMNIFEKTTGTDIIRRLVKKGFVIEYEDPDDRRSKRVKMSEKGFQILSSVLPALGKVSALLSSPLSTDEKMMLNNYLDDVNSFQENIFLNHRSDDLDTLYGFLDKTAK